MRYTPIRDRRSRSSAWPSTGTTKDEQTGEWKKETEWFRVVLFRENAERAAE